MKKVSEVLEPKIVTGYMGSKATYEDVKMQLEERFGKKVAANYNPATNCATYNTWKKAGYEVIKDEKSLKSVTFIEKEDEETGEIKRIRRTVSLFHRCQVQLAEPVTKQAVWAAKWPLYARRELKMNHVSVSPINA